MKYCLCMKIDLAARNERTQGDTQDTRAQRRHRGHKGTQGDTRGHKGTLRTQGTQGDTGDPRGHRGHKETLGTQGDTGNRGHGNQLSNYNPTK